VQFADGIFVAHAIYRVH